MHSTVRNGNSPDHPLRKLWLMCHRTCNIFSRCGEAIFIGAGVTPQQVGVLEALKYAEEPMTVSRVANFLDRDVNAITMTVNRMEEAGLVIRVRDLPDRRAVRLVATEKGKNAYARAEQKGFDFIVSALSDLSPGEIEQATLYMQKMKQAAQAELTSQKKHARDKNT